MNYSGLKRALRIAIKAVRPVFVWGGPGTGKSSVVYQVAKELGYNFKDTRAVHYDPVDFRGIPKVVGDVTKWFPPDFLPSLGAPNKGDGDKGIWFLDELNAAPQAVQAALYQLILDRRLGDYVLPDGWVIIAAGNRETDRAITNRMSSALANRFAGHYELEVDAAEWKVWALESGVVPELIAFFAWRPQLLYGFDPARSDKAFTTPRSVEMLSDLVKAGLDPEKDYEMVSSCVGQATATELTGFHRIYRSLPDLDEVLAKPDTVKLPRENIGAMYALVGALARRASKKTMPAIVTLAKRIGSDFGVLLIKDSITANRSVADTGAYVEWAKDNQSVLI